MRSNAWSRTMTPQIPGYLLSFESIVRPLVTIIALGLIWLGAARMPASAKSRYAPAGVREGAVRDCGRAIGGAHRLGGCCSVSRRGKYVFRNRRHRGGRGADDIVRFADPARCRRHCPVAIGKHRKAGLRDPAALA